MRVLFLYGDNLPRLIDELMRLGDEVITCNEKITLDTINTIDPEFIISFGYRYIIGKSIVNKYHGRMVNLHISFLPWNRGADPNFWSIWDNTPKGVTVHLIDEGLDTGCILVQREVDFTAEETLASSYEKLQTEITELFLENWNQIKRREVEALPQKGEGTFHKKFEFELLRETYGITWDMHVDDVLKLREQEVKLWQ